MDKNPSKFFDKILSFLSSDYNRIFTVDEIKNKIYEKEISKINNTKNIDELFSDTYFETNVINAIMFLNREGLVAYNEKDKTAFINTKGFVKHKTENFTEEIRNKGVNLWLQRSSWFCSILALSFSTYSIFFKNENPSNISLGCNCETVKSSTASQSDSKVEEEKLKSIQIKKINKKD